MARKNVQDNDDVIFTAKIDALRSLCFDSNSVKFRKIDHLVFLYIATFAWGDNGICKQSIKQIAEDFGKKRITIQHATKRLERLGYIQYVYRVRKHDEVIVELDSWKAVTKMKRDGNNVISTWFRIAKPGFKTYSKTKQRKPRG